MSYICFNCKSKVEEHFKITSTQDAVNCKCEICGKRRKCINYKIEKKESKSK